MLSPLPPNGEGPPRHEEPESMSNDKTMRLSYVQDPILGGFIVAHEAADPTPSAVPEPVDDAIDAEFIIVESDGNSTSAPASVPSPPAEGFTRPTRWLKSLPGYLQRPRPIDPVRERERQLVRDELERSRMDMRTEFEQRMQSFRQNARVHIENETDDLIDSESQEPSPHVQHHEQ